MDIQKSIETLGRMQIFEETKGGSFHAHDEHFFVCMRFNFIFMLFDKLVAIIFMGWENTSVV